jgi:membrane-associated HD superfamily phosphohydrolase
MPIDPGAAALAQGGMNVYGSGLQGLMTVRQNKLNRQWSEKMYARQQADMIRFWNMQNAYNHPKAQFDRMVGSGLNPKLMYEKGSPGTAGPIQTPDMQPVEFRTPDFGSALYAAGGALTSMYDLQVKQAQANLLDKQAAKVNEEAAIAALEAKYQDANYWNRLQGAEAQTDKILQEMQTLKNRDIREQVMHTQNLAEAAQRLKNLIAQENLSKQQLQNLEESYNAIVKDNVLRDIRIASGDVKSIKFFQQLWELLIDSVYKNMPAGSITDQVPGGYPNLKKR